MISICFSLKLFSPFFKERLWIRLRLPSCRPGFESLAHPPSMLLSSCIGIVSCWKDENKQKDAGCGPFLKRKAFSFLFVIPRFCDRSGVEPMTFKGWPLSWSLFKKNNRPNLASFCLFRSFHQKNAAQILNSKTKNAAQNSTKNARTSLIILNYSRVLKPLRWCPLH